MDITVTPINITLVLISLITTVGTIVVARMSKKLNEIHIMVNSNLEAARQERATAIRALAALNERHAEIVAAAATQSGLIANAAADAASKVTLDSLRKIIAEEKVGH